MRLREETVVPLAALLLSLSAHAGMLALKPGFLASAPVPTVETIVVELLTEEKSEEPLSVALPAEAPAPPAAPPPRAAVAAKAAQAKRTPSPPLQVSDLPKLQISKAPPLPDDVPIGEATSYLPDPSGSGATEATLKMTDDDARYRGFVDAVREAVYRKWDSRDAMLKAKRSGTVTLRFTLVAGGGGSSEVSLLASSGSDLLDSEAVRAVRTARLPPFPEHWTLQRLHMVGDFQYSFAGAGR